MITILTYIHINHTYKRPRAGTQQSAIAMATEIVRELACEQSRVLVLIFEKFLLFILNALHRERKRAGNFRPASNLRLVFIVKSHVFLRHNLRIIQRLKNISYPLTS